ncbi:MAG: FKBP-type peptidyl-prolyl cis-trans isomerase [Prevotellaceae bacterium]|jgi:FKBP-type peptidyl-prolyl cis-trans isomerase FklB|nr:FKBP-type peptidyl-prolyl cis-trans isomerase [Prevotellaceae bacterium]
MKKLIIFMSVLAGIIAASSCQSRLNGSSSDIDSLSYSIGVMWGYQMTMDRLDFVNISKAIAQLKQKIKEPVSAENNIYTLSMQLREFLQKSPQRVYTKPEKEHVTTLLGAVWAHQLNEANILRLNLKYTKQGIRDMMKNDTASLQLKLEQSNNYIMEYKIRFEKRENEKRLEEGRRFFEKNKNEEGVVTTESGLQYKVINQGNDEKTAIGDTAYINIAITQINGDTIENSSEKAYFIAENRLIKGLFEGLLLFGEGAKFTLYIPSELAFGSTVEPWITQKIKPDMALIYNIEIKKLIKNNSHSKSKRK